MIDFARAGFVTDKRSDVPFLTYCSREVTKCTKTHNLEFRLCNSLRVRADDGLFFFCEQTPNRFD